MSNRTVILAIDSGGTKCEMLAVDAATGEIIREVRHQAGSLPAACRPKENFGGAGRTAEVLGYCLDEMLDGLDFQKLLPAGNISKEMVEKGLARHGLTAEDYQPIGEIDGVFYSQAMTWGIAISAGTGTVGMVWPPEEKQTAGPLLNGRVADVVKFANNGRLLFDAVGPLLGDWGSAYSIGLDFLRRAYREQESQNEPLAEMQAICAHLDAFSGIERKPDEKKLSDNYRYLSHFIYTYTDRSIIASLSRVCGDCAKNGSELAKNGWQRFGGKRDPRREAEWDRQDGFSRIGVRQRADERRHGFRRDEGATRTGDAAGHIDPRAASAGLRAGRGEIHETGSRELSRRHARFLCKLS